MYIKFGENAPYEVVNVRGKPYIFSNLRIERDSIPKGLYAYDVRDCDCDGRFLEVKDHIMVNHLGTIIGKDKIPLDDQGNYWCDYTDDFEDEKDGLFLFGTVSDAKEYLEYYNDFCKEIKESIGIKEPIKIEYGD